LVTVGYKVLKTFESHLRHKLATCCKYPLLFTIHYNCIYPIFDNISRIVLYKLLYNRMIFALEIQHTLPTSVLFGI